jgi:hypothetical protein
MWTVFMDESVDGPNEFEPSLAKCELVKLWQNRMWRASLAHYVAADKYRRWHAGLTLFNMVAAISVLFLSNNEFRSSAVDFFCISCGRMVRSNLGLAD